MTQSAQSPIRLRLNARLEMREMDSADSCPVLLVSADAIGLTLRASKPHPVGTILHLTGEPSLNESFTFKAIVTATQSRELPEEELAYAEIQAEVREGEGAYHSFLGALARTYRELSEDLRFILPLPARLRLNKHWIETKVENVSFGGVFVVVPSGHDVSLGEVLDFELSFPGGQTQKGAGLVVYRVTEKLAKKQGGQPGVGLRLDFTLTSREKWGQAIDALRTHPYI